MLVDQRLTVSQEISRLGRAAGVKQRFQAKGRLPSGTMNKTEEAYSRHLEALKAAGEILWFRFEAIKLRLAPNTFITLDFAVMRTDAVLELHDVKGAKAIMQDDAKVKIKVAADAYPLVFKMAFPKRGGGWLIEEIGA